MENLLYGKEKVRMKEKLGNNLSLKILSVLIAIFIWIVASSESDPIDTIGYSVKVNVINSNYIYKLDKTYQIKDENQTVTVYITGKSSVISNRHDIKVQADLTQIVDMNADPAYAPLQFVPVAGISMEDVNIIPKTIPVYIEDIERKDFVITVNPRGTPGTGYEIGECTASLDKITVQGPKSIVEQINSVVASVDVYGMTEDTEKKAKLQFADAQGTNLSDDAVSYLQFSDNIGEERVVDVNVEIWKIVDNIKVEAEYSGYPAYGYQVDKITTTPETISVAGNEEALQKLKENNNTIKIPASLINVDGLNQDVEANIKLNSLLKEEDGYKIPSNRTQSVLVKVSILPYGSKEFEVSVSEITHTNLEKDLRLIFNQNLVKVRVKGNYANLDSLTVDQIEMSIDLKDKLEGEYTIPVTVTLPNGYEQVENCVTTVQLTKMESDK